MEGVGGIGDGGVELGKARFIVGVLDRGLRLEQEGDEDQEQGNLGEEIGGF